MPDEPAAALRAAEAANERPASAALRISCCSIACFVGQQIDVRIFKGIPLAITAFQDPTLRDAGDIDLLVAEKDVFTAGEILRARATCDSSRRRGSPRAGCAPTSRIKKIFRTDIPGSDVVIDLHWRLFRNPFLPANAGLTEVGEDWLDLGSERIADLARTPVVALSLRAWSARRLAAPQMAGRYRRSYAHHDAGATCFDRDTGGGTTGVAAVERRHPSLPGTARPGIADPQHARDSLDRNDSTVAHILRFSKRLMTSNQCRPIREQIPSTQWFLNEFRLYTSLGYRLDLLAAISVPPSCLAHGLICPTLSSLFTP